MICCVSASNNIHTSRYIYTQMQTLKHMYCIVALSLPCTPIVFSKTTLRIDGGFEVRSFALYARCINLLNNSKNPLERKCINTTHFPLTENQKKNFSFCSRNLFIENLKNSFSFFCCSLTTTMRFDS